MLVARHVPIRGIAMQAVGRFFPHEGGVQAGRRLARIEERRAGAPHDGGRYPALLVMPDHLGELVEVLETHDYHEGAVEFRMMRGGCVARRLLQNEVEREERRDEVVGEGGGPVAQERWQKRRIEQLEE